MQILNHAFPWKDTFFLEGLNLENNKDPSNAVVPLYDYLKYPQKTNDKNSLPRVFFTPGFDTIFTTIDHTDGKTGELMCKKCNAMICKHAAINDKERTWICPFCSSLNYLGENQTFRNRNELNHDFYEMLLPNEYLVPATPQIYFIIDISFPSVTSGFRCEFISAILENMNHIPKNFKVGLMTVSDKVKLYDLKTGQYSEITHKRDLQNCNIETQNIGTCEQTLANCLDQIRNEEIDPSIDGHCILSGVRFIYHLMKSSCIIIMGFTGLNRFGQFKLEEKSNNDSEQALFKVSDQIAPNKSRSLPSKLQSRGFTVFSFVGGMKYCDIATIGRLSLATSGKIFFYQNLLNEEKERLRHDLNNAFTQKYFWKCNIKSFASDNTKLLKRLKNNHTNSIHIPVVSPSHSLKFSFADLQNVAEVNETTFLHCQFQMYYSTSPTMRAVRVFNFSLPFTNDPTIYLSSINQPYQMYMLFSDMVITTLKYGSISANRKIMSELYTKYHFYPDSTFHFLHSFMCNFIAQKCSKHESDRKAATLYNILLNDQLYSLLFFYPRLICIDPISIDFINSNTSQQNNKDEDSEIVLKNFKILPLQIKSFDKGTLFVLHQHDTFSIIVRNNIGKKLLINVFDVDNITKIDKKLPKIEKMENKILWTLYQKACLLSKMTLFMKIIIERNSQEDINNIFVDDSKINGCTLYPWISEFYLLASLQNPT